MAEEARVRLLIAGLLSGDYVQGRYQMHLVKSRSTRKPAHLASRDWESLPDDCWCPYGIACDVACRNGLDLPRAWNPAGVELFGRYRHGYLLPGEAAEWYGFSERSPLLVTAGGQQVRGSVLNDAGAPFAVTACGFARAFLDDRFRSCPCGLGQYELCPGFPHAEG